MRKMFSVLIASMSISLLQYCTRVLQDIAIEANWVKDTCDLSVLFFRMHVDLQLPQSKEFN